MSRIPSPLPLLRLSSLFEKPLTGVATRPESLPIREHLYTSPPFDEPILPPDEEEYERTEAVSRKLVYDYDQEMADYCESIGERLPDSSREKFASRDERNIRFDSVFESGNLAQAIETRREGGDIEYELVLNADLNSSSHCQWYYFEMSNFEVLLEVVPYIVLYYIGTPK